MILTVRRTSPLALLATLAVAAAGCGTSRTDTGSATPACQSCHGGAAGNAAPPRAVAGDTATTSYAVGAHQAHLADSAFRAAIACDECHVVPASGTAHADGVAGIWWGPLATSGGATPMLEVSLGVGTKTGSCSGVYCHGATLAAGGSSTTPIWNAAAPAALDCGSCHGAPPPSPHTAGTNCATCHPETVRPDGTIDVAGGHHINGQLETPAGHGDYAAPAVHGPKFFESLAGAPGAADCTACHGAAYEGGSGPSCNACHTSAGWTGWNTNCSFCHGTRSAATQAGYDVALRPEWSAPPDALAQRLDPAHAPVPARTGAHQAHLTGLGSSTGTPYAAPFACATCHTVPTDEAHAGGPGRAPVALKGSGGLPADLGTYAPDTGSCTTYCHGTTLADDLGATAPPPTWAAAELGCAGCHGNPPASGRHALHATTNGLACFVCHATTIGTDGAIGAAHVDGARTVTFITPAVATWDGVGCTAVCHPSPASLPWRP